MHHQYIRQILAKPAITTPTYMSGIKNTKHEQTCQAKPVLQYSVMFKKKKKGGGGGRLFPSTSLWLYKPVLVDIAATLQTKKS